MHSLALPWPDEAEQTWRAHLRRPDEPDWRATCARLAGQRCRGGLPAATREVAAAIERRAFLPAVGLWAQDSQALWPVVYVNVIAAVLDPFEPGARLDLESLESAAAAAGRYARRIEPDFPGESRFEVGVLGLADALAMLGHRYESWTARGVALDVFAALGRAVGAAGARFTAGSEPLVCALAGNASPGIEPLGVTGPSFARSLWRYRYRDAAPPMALEAAGTALPDARDAMAAALQGRLGNQSARPR